MVQSGQLIPPGRIVYGAPEAVQRPLSKRQMATISQDREASQHRTAHRMQGVAALWY